MRQRLSSNRRPLSSREPRRTGLLLFNLLRAAYIVTFYYATRQFIQAQSVRSGTRSLSPIPDSTEEASASLSIFMGARTY